MNVYCLTVVTFGVTFVIREFGFRPAKGEDGPEALAPQRADDFNRHFASVGPHIAAELAAGNPPRLSPKSHV